MGWDFKVRRADRVPLGNITQVQAALSKVLPGIAFAYYQDKLANEDGDVGYSRCEGNFTGDTFAIQLQIPVSDEIRGFQGGVWGVGGDTVVSYLKALESSTGWEIVPPGS